MMTLLVVIGVAGILVGVVGFILYKVLEHDYN